MAVNIYECGDMSDVVISTNTYKGLISIISNGVSGDVYISFSKSPITFLCSGSLSIDAPLNSINVFLSSVVSASTFIENGLMGLAGVVCASFFSYVLVKYAV